MSWQQVELIIEIVFPENSCDINPGKTSEHIGCFVVAITSVVNCILLLDRLLKLM